MHAKRDGRFSFSFPCPFFSCCLVASQRADLVRRGHLIRPGFNYIVFTI